ncbi:MAG: sulfite exporter TauE/SafE family protein [Pseudomonadota bacterium]
MFSFANLFLAGVACGGINAIAGGGTLIGFPVLLGAGLPPTVANATNFIATMPGYAAAIPSYLGELKQLSQSAMTNTLWTVAGATLGSLLLVLSGDAVFVGLIPYLILTATLLYAFSDRVNRLFSSEKVRLNAKGIRLSNLILFIVCIYGGYFGAGLGIILFSALKIVGYCDFHHANALKNLIITVASLVSIGIFIFGSLIAWPEAITMMLGSALGGYVTAKKAKLMSQNYLHLFVTLFGFASTIYYFVVV